MTTLYERLTTSIFRDDAAALSQALNDGARLDWPNDRGLTALHQCVWLQRCELIVFLLTKHNAKADELAGAPGFESTALETAVSMNAGAVVEVLLANGANIHRTNKFHHSAMDVAAHYNRVEMVELLLRHGASANTTAKTQPIVHAVKWKSIAMFMLLLEHGASIKTKDRSGLPLLHLAIQVGAHEIWSWLIDQRLLLDATDRSGNTPLHAAATANAVEAARRLLGEKASAYATNKDDRTPLDVTTLHNAQDVVTLLLEDGCASFDQLNKLQVTASPPSVASTNRLGTASSVPAGKPTADSTALAKAVAANDGAMVELLLAFGMDIHSTDLNGDSVVDVAAQNDRVEMMELLLRRGASVNSKAKTQPIVHAVTATSITMFALLVEHGASIEIKDQSGLSLLHQAIQADAYEICCWLIDQRLLLETTDHDGNTPLHVAAETNALAVAKRLLREQAPKDAKNKDGRTPLDVAVLHDAQDVIRLLLEDEGVHFAQLHKTDSSTPDCAATASLTSNDSTTSLNASSASSAAGLQVVRSSRVITYATMRILTAKSLRSVLVMGTQSPFCSWTLRHTTTVLARGQTSRHRQGGKQANWTSESFPLSIADLKSKDRHSVSLMECSLEFEVRTPTGVPGMTKSIGMATFAMNLLSTQAPAGSRTGHSVSLFHKGIVAGELLVELLY